MARRHEGIEKSRRRSARRHQVFFGLRVDTPGEDFVGHLKKMAAPEGRGTSSRGAAGTYPPAAASLPGAGREHGLLVDLEGNVFVLFVPSIFCASFSLQLAHPSK